MVVQVLAYAFQGMDDRNAQRLEMLRIANPRQLQDLRRADGAGGEDRLALRLHADALVAVNEIKALAALLLKVEL